MTYLLDVNALIALGFKEHEFHRRVSIWVAAEAKKPAFAMATSPVTELGFVRVLSQIKSYDISVRDGIAILTALKRAARPRVLFVPDSASVEQLPRWVKTGRQTTDGHLIQLCKSNGLSLATLDKGIPGSYYIPEI